MACLMRRCLVTCCQRRLFHTAVPLGKIRYKNFEDFTPNYDKNFEDFTPNYDVTVRKPWKSRESKLLQQLRHDLLETDLEVSRSFITQLEEQFKEEGNDHLGNFDLILMTLLRSKNRAKEARLLMNYIREQREPSVLVLIKYMDCCRVEYPNLTLNEYKALRKTLDLETVNIDSLINLVKIVAATPLWRDSYEMLNLLESEVEGGEARHVLDRGIAVMLCGGIVSSNYELLLEVAYKHPVWFNHGMRRGTIMSALYDMWKSGRMQMDLCFELMHDMGQFMTFQVEQAQELKQYCERELADKVKSRLTEVDVKSGRCKNCKQLLTHRSLTAGEYTLLKKSVFEDIVYGKNIYESTTPDAIAHLLSFLGDRHYDVVVDGPNTYFKRDEKFWVNFTKMLLQLKAFLVKDKVKALVVVDKFRLKKFYRLPMHLKKFVDVYIVDHRLSNDDVFMLVATFRSGPDTYLITNDNLRNHKFRLRDPCDKLFSIWQKRRQIMHDYLDLQFPQAHDSSTHVNEEGWHVPFEDPDRRESMKKDQCVAYFKDTCQFLCLQKLQPFESAQLKTWRRMRKEFEEKYGVNH